MEFVIDLQRIRTAFVSAAMSYGEMLVMLVGAAVALRGFFVSGKRGYVVLAVAFVLWSAWSTKYMVYSYFHQKTLSQEQIQHDAAIEAEIQNIYERHGAPTTAFTVPRIFSFPLCPLIALGGIWMLVRKETRTIR